MDKKIFILVLVIGVLASITGMYQFYSTIGLLNRSLTATATVVELVYNNEGQASPILQYTCNTGSTVTTSLNIAQKPPAYSVGDKVEIIYDTNNSNNVRVNSFFGIWLTPILLTFLGIVFVLIGFANYWGSRQWI